METGPGEAKYAPTSIEDAEIVTFDNVTDLLIDAGRIQIGMTSNGIILVDFEHSAYPGSLTQFQMLFELHYDGEESFVYRLYILQRQLGDEDILAEAIARQIFDEQIIPIIAEGELLKRAYLLIRNRISFLN